VTELLLVRHGETDWNRELRFQGQADPPLNDAGRAQARELARTLAEVEIDAVYTSDLRRAVETAEIVAAGRGIPILAEPGLREVDVGSWSGLTREQIEERFPGARDHDGETREAHLARVVATVERIAAENDGKRVLIVSHGGSLRALHGHALKVESVPRIANCAVYRLAFRNGTLAGID